MANKFFFSSVSRHESLLFGHALNFWQKQRDPEKKEIDKRNVDRNQFLCAI